ncbi:MAG: penicillin acylase family protein [Actinomycetota bacterium]|nr:penicillin acylase family protein [Actinomycetota bacterium]
MIRAVALAAGLALVALSAAGGAPSTEYAAVALNVLPPGQSGDLLFPPTASDQLKLYDGLTPRGANVRPADLTRYFKPERFGVTGKVVRTERPRPGLRILRDRWDVPHVYGRTRADVEFGAGYATAEDRFILMELLRGPGRLAALDAPGLDPFALATSGRQFVPTQATEERVAAQLKLVRAAGRKGRQLYADVRSYVAGINAYYKKRNQGLRPWTTTDVIAVGSLLGADLGVGGGDETRRSMFFDALRRRVGLERAPVLWDWLAEKQDPSAPVSVDGSFPYDPGPALQSGNVLLEDGSFEPSSPPSTFQFENPVAASNALLVSARLSATHHPLFVAGPQVGYTYPELLLELDLHGGGIDARGASFPGLSFYVLLGRGKDFAWSATSANSDIVDQYVETLCGGDDAHYLYMGECRAMTTFDAGVLKGTASEPDREIAFRETVHGPVLGYATSTDGQRVAISTKRSTRGRELLSALAFQDLNTNRVHDARSFFGAMNQLEFTFNWFYADDRDIAMFSSGRLPIRAANVGSGLPTEGTGDHEWRGILPLSRHVRGINPTSGVILNWNNKPGRGFSSSDDNWSFGPVQRVRLLREAVALRKVHTLATLTGAMNRAATQDLRTVAVLPVLEHYLSGTAPNAFDNQLLSLMVDWRKNGASRLDVDLDGKIDDPGAAIMDAVWPRLADVLMRPTLGPLTDRLKALLGVDDQANPGGSSYFGGWYGYVVRDLTASTPTFCGGGDPGRCLASLWHAIDEAGSALAAAQGPDPTGWRADATGERLTFGFLPQTARWTNRPTFQQIISFDSHRPR